MNSDFQETYKNDTDYSLVVVEHDWHVIHISWTGERTELTLKRRTGAQAKHLVQRFCMPTHIRFWEFWKGKLYVYKYECEVLESMESGSGEPAGKMLL